MPNDIRPYRPSDLKALVDTSIAADTLFTEHGLTLPPDDPAQLVHDAEHLLVTGQPVIGFAALTTVDGNLHLAQLAVHRHHGRRGVGTRLLDAALHHARTHGLPAVTLTTFCDLPFNAPWYRTRGFTDFAPTHWGPDLHRLRHHETAAGLDVAPRIAMRRVVPEDAGTR